MFDNQLPKKSLNAGLPAGWSELSSADGGPCRLAGIGLISLALRLGPVDAQPVASTTVIPSATVSSAARVNCFTKAPEPWSASKLLLLDEQTNSATC
jgi:hypothetical protein